jgi:hypothetical protein
MSNTEKIQEKSTVVAEEIEVLSHIDSDTVESFLPPMNISVPQTGPVPEQNQLISDEQYLGFIDEIMTNMREDRKQVSDFIDTFSDMVLNDGDATTSSKEALVNLINTKVNLQDKMLKAADLMTRLKLKNPYAYSGPHLNALQQNNINIGSENTEFNRKDIIKAINAAKKKPKE